MRQGDLNVEVNFAKRNDEIGDLGRDFNDMVRQLRESREEIQRLYRTQMSRAEHLATLGELATGLAHEIRNPLAGIAGVMEIVGRDLPESSPAREVLSEVQQEILQIKRILSDLLETARPKPPDFRPSDLNSTAEHAVSLARQQALSRPIEIKLSKAHELAPVEHDAGQIQQVLLNLLLNALQAIDDAGNIRVRLGVRGWLCDGRDFRHWPRHSTGAPGQHLPPLLHHQEAGHRPRALAGVAHRRRRTADESRSRALRARAASSWCGCRSATPRPQNERPDLE